MASQKLIMTACCLLMISSLAQCSLEMGQKHPLSEEELQSEEFRGALNAATIELNRISNSAYFHAAIGVTTATKQVVAGLLYEFSAQFEQTSCENREELLQQNADSCQPEGERQELHLSCSFRVLRQAWQPNAAAQYTLVSQPSCAQFRMQPRLQQQPGGKEPLLPEELQSQEFTGALHAAAVAFNSGSYLPNLHLVASTKQATKQVVAGILYEFNADLVETECENVEGNYNMDLGQCPPTNRQRRFECRNRILFQPWAEPQYTSVGDRNCIVKL